MKIKAMLIILLLLAGCASVPGPIHNPAASNAGSASFARSVLDKQEVSFHDGMRGVILFAVGKRLDMSYQSCIKFLSEKQMIGDHWPDKYKEDSPLTRGMLANMLVRVMGIRGGVTMQVFGPGQRYALRECQKLGIIQKGSQNSTVSGREFLSILRKAGEYIKNTVDKG